MILEDPRRMGRNGWQNICGLDRRFSKITAKFISIDLLSPNTHIVRLTMFDRGLVPRFGFASEPSDVANGSIVLVTVPVPPSFQALGWQRSGVRLYV